MLWIFLYKDAFFGLVVVLHKVPVIMGDKLARAGFAKGHKFDCRRRFLMFFPGSWRDKDIQTSRFPYPLCSWPSSIAKYYAMLCNFFLLLPHDPVVFNNPFPALFYSASRSLVPLRLVVTITFLWSTRYRLWHISCTYQEFSSVSNLKVQAYFWATRR